MPYCKLLLNECGILLLHQMLHVNDNSILKKRSANIFLTYSLKFLLGLIFSFKDKRCYTCSVVEKNDL